LPTFPEDKKYILSLVNYGNFSKEGIYAIATNSEVSVTEFEDFYETGAFEPNDSEFEATPITVGENQKISYIEYEDKDFFTISALENNMSLEEIENRPPTVDISISTLSGTVDNNISFNFSGFDDVGIERFELTSSIDGLLYSGKNSSFSTKLSAGDHVLRVKAFDKWNRFSLKEINISITDKALFDISVFDQSYFE
jgi:hypothetical protein